MSANIVKKHNIAIHRPKDVGRMLGVSQATFWRLVKDGKIGVVKISKRATGVTQDEIERFLAEIRK